MKWYLRSFLSAKDDWLISGLTSYENKIKHHINFNLELIKPPKFSRDQKLLKIKKEEELFLSRLESKDHVINFDERGKSLSSEEFAKLLKDLEESGRSKVVFHIGGSFGLGNEVKTRANHSISLSPFVFNHQIALLVAMEQIYRAQMIQKGLPYHNE